MTLMLMFVFGLLVLGLFDFVINLLTAVFMLGQNKQLDDLVERHHDKKGE